MTFFKCCSKILLNQKKKGAPQKREQRDKKMEKNKIYESYPYRLDVEHQEKHEIYEGNGYYEIVFISVWSSSDGHVRIAKELLNKEDFGNLEKIGEIVSDIEYGCYDNKNCQIFFRGKWYSGKTICKIQADRKDDDWKKYV